MYLNEVALVPTSDALYRPIDNSLFDDQVIWGEDPNPFAEWMNQHFYPVCLQNKTE